ncbi:MAG: bacillithiol biosynthesis cysteine-adding enzyme BshC [Gemmatimonadales bacterium]
MIHFKDTPLAADLAWPAPRAGGVAPALQPAFVAAAGTPLAKKLALPNVVAVTAGQQPGLFTGPLYTIHKALSARALAAALERRWQRPVVPIFWLAGDDHDHAEAAGAFWVAQDGTLATASLPPRPAAGPQPPLSRDPLPAEVTEAIDRLGADLPDGPARQSVVGWLHRHYQAGRPIAAAYGGALAELLTPLGVACFDPTSVTAKQAAAPIFRRALGQAGSLDQHLSARSRRLAETGTEVDVRVGDGATLLFLDGPMGRDRLVIDGDGFRTRRGGETYSAVALDQLLTSAPERFSANVLLRPVVEAAILPTVAYLAGPGELRYLRLAEALYQPLGVERQLPLPRWSGIAIEPRVVRTLDKFQIAVEDLAADPKAVEARVLKSVAPAEFDPAFADLRAAIEGGFARVAAVARAIDPTLEKPATSAKGTALGQLAELEKRLLAAQKRRQGELVAQLDRAAAAIVPGGKPQERVLGVASFLGRYGPEFLEELANHIDGWYRAALEGRADSP